MHLHIITVRSRWRKTFLAFYLVKRPALFTTHAVRKLGARLLSVWHAILKKLKHFRKSDCVKIRPLQNICEFGVKKGIYYQIVNGFDEYEFPKDAVFNLINPDVNQEIYGVPEYLAALQSSFLKWKCDIVPSQILFERCACGFDYLYDWPNAKQRRHWSNQNTNPPNKKALATLRIYLCIFLTAGKDGMQVIPLSDAVAKMTS